MRKVTVPLEHFFHPILSGEPLQATVVPIRIDVENGGVTLFKSQVEEVFFDEVGC